MEDVVKALRWLAKETEFVFAAKQLRDAADLIEVLHDENTELRRENSEYQDAQHELFMALCKSMRREKAAVEDLCGACESLTHATGRGWEDSCAACKWRGVQAGEETE